MVFKTIVHPFTKKEYNLTSISGMEILNSYLSNIMNENQNEKENGGSKFTFTYKNKMYRKKNRYTLKK